MKKKKRRTLKHVSIGFYLSNSIEPWQRSEIERIAKRAYELGRKHEKEERLQTVK